MNGSSDRIQLDKHQIRVLRGQSEVVSITRKPETTLARQKPGQPSVLKKEQPDITADFKWPAKTKTSKIQDFPTLLREFSHLGKTQTFRQ
ncbi:MAG: hypothetical protein CME31_28080 [Gimesia sp.]|uniref:Uncharacterized protein n=1 Tax=Gimesia maris TaxID=122 RepID=A0A3D3R6B3_9PLAN|nr:hypothetical protein [Gimesia sp.]HCO24404.1 hypothetical protein [Gimesia maris]